MTSHRIILSILESFQTIFWLFFGIYVFQPFQPDHTLKINNLMGFWFDPKFQLHIVYKDSCLWHLVKSEFIYAEK